MLQAHDSQCGIIRLRDLGGLMMRITYDTKADALYISLQDGVFAANREVEHGVVLDIGANDELLGIEILDAATRLNLSDIAKVSIEMPLNLTEARE
jgi:uncharacterized protein YuzE